ncbi:hypothetical protein DCO58_10260 [Helicobacter saguini]|uniref:Conjugal transfer protein TrbL n=1 Tax=Helicobacter saguini TaxID=1548018 RepID=A0A347VPK8_9HELI|nr:type IV secretion system protein [Helicobacter saguini]MWV61313.1 hypothetical protein [Helicobacter saguini]MWV68018.1 hypothetical protein [Helicobacter saguini]MWV70515.1 hypothetical protein [Helicobacter saguini]MWV72418.1 hypothetical protein [Helicobacter saguini]TLD94817.1 hypothetical protein LS64_004805 [Helicobacter saguini]
MAQNQGLYHSVESAVGNVAVTMQETLFTWAKDLFTSYLSIAILTITLCVFIYTKIGKEWNKEDFYKMGVWLVTYAIICAIYSSFEVFKEALNILVTPLEWFYGAIKGSGSSMNLANGVDTLITWLNEVVGGMLQKWTWDEASTYIYALMAMLLWVVMMLFIVFIVIFTILIKFAALLILSLCPIMLPCLVIQPLRGYFWSWFKLYVSTALQAPLAWLVGGAIMLGLESSRNMQLNENTPDTQVAVICLTPIIVTLIGIALLSKIPAWCQAIVGSASGDHKTGVAGAVAGAGGMAMKGMKQFSKSGSDINHNTGQKNGLGRRMASAGLAMVGMEGMAQKMAGQNEGAKNARREQLMSGAFTASATPHMDNSKGKQK